MDVKQILRKTQSNADVLELGLPAKLSRFRADRLCVRVEVTFTDTSASPNTVEREGFCTSARLDWARRTYKRPPARDPVDIT